MVQLPQHLKQFKVNVGAEARGSGQPGPALLAEGPGGGRDLHQDTDTCRLFTRRCLSPGEARFEISFDTPCYVDEVFIYLVRVLVGPYS